MEEIQTSIYNYICKANRKIALLSSEANNLLNKTGCNCDISSYIEDILDINSSFYILHKGWDNIEETFGYKNFLLALFPEEDFDAATATLEILDAYIDRYNMVEGSVIVTPLFPNMELGASCCDGFVGSLYYNKTESDERYYPRFSNPENYLKTVDLSGIATEDFVISQGYLTEEYDPTVPVHVKEITEIDIDYWNSKLDTEVDPTVPSHVKNITNIDIDNWNNKLETETDPTVPNYVKSISTFDIIDWNQAYQTTLDLTPLFIPANIFTQLGFSRLGGYIVGTESQPISGSNISLSIGGNVSFARAVLFHSHTSKPTFSGTGITVTEIGDYIPNQVNEIILFYNGSGRVVALYTGETNSSSVGLITRGTTSFTSDTSINVSGFTWEINGSQYSSGSIVGIPVTARPAFGVRVDAVWGNSSGLVLYSVGSDSLNEVFTGYPDRVLLSLLVRKSEAYSHPSYTPIDVNTNLSTGFVISRVVTDSIGSVTLVQSKEISKNDVGLDQVDNTSDLNKPVSDAVLAAINALDLRFLRKDVNDTNDLFYLTLGGLNVDGDVVFSDISDEISPDYSVVIMNDGSIKRSSYVGLSNISDLQGQINSLDIRISSIEDDINDWAYVVRPVQLEYPTKEDMAADQNNHVSGYIYYDQELDVYYQYLGTTGYSLVDYRPIGGLGLSPVITASTGLEKIVNDIRLGVPNTNSRVVDITNFQEHGAFSFSGNTVNSITGFDEIVDLSVSLGKKPLGHPNQDVTNPTIYLNNQVYKTSVGRWAGAGLIIESKHWQAAGDTISSYIDLSGGISGSYTGLRLDASQAGASRFTNLRLAVNDYSSGDKYQSLLLSSSAQAIFRDDFFNRGLVYNGDYEANFVARSLITKQYLEGGFSSNLSGRGLSFSSTKLHVGDPYAGNFNESYIRLEDYYSVNTATFGIIHDTAISSINNYYGLTNVVNSSRNTFLAESYRGDFSGYSIYASTEVAGSVVNLSVYDPIAGNFADINVDTNGATVFTISDSILSKGAVYGGDYEANFVSRSLITKQYLDAAIATIDLSGYALISHTHLAADITDLSGLLDDKADILSLNNIVQTIYIDVVDLSGTGSIEDQVVEYINDNISIISTLETSKINIILQGDVSGFPYTLPFILS